MPVAPTKTYYTRCSCGRLVNERLPGGSKYYYLFDGQQSVVGLTDSSNGKEVDAYDYDPYGGILNVIPNQPSNPFQYEGGYFESSTGLVKFGTRYYNPNLGRWTQQDPDGGSLASPDTLNRYLYAADDPVNLRDPSGKDTGECVGAITAVVVGSLLSFFTVGVWAGELVLFIAGIPIIGPPIAILLALALFYAFYNAGIFLYNSVIAPACGWPRFPYLEV